jgi:flagellar hook-length control protein FliK
MTTVAEVLGADPVEIAAPASSAPASSDGQSPPGDDRPAAGGPGDQPVTVRSEARAATGSLFDVQLAPARAEAATGADAGGATGSPDPLWRQVHRALNAVRLTSGGDHELTIRLRPDDLGSVMVKVTTGDGGTTVALVADTRAAANQLQQQRHELLRQFEASGLGQTTVDIGLSSGSRQSGDNQDGSGKHPTAAPSAPSRRPGPVSPAAASPASRPRTPSGGVDLAL